MKNSNAIHLPTKFLFKIWILCFFIKLLFAFGYSHLIFLQKPERKVGFISYASGDQYSYLGAMENYITTGNYYFINQLGDTIKAGRSPHFAIPYFFARKILSKNLATDFLTIVNVALDSFAILIVALMAFTMGSNSKKSFYIAIALGLISTYVSNWSFITLPDCGGAALLMIGYYFYWKAYSNIGKLSLNVLLASLFFTWSIMYRPYLIIIIVCLAAIFLFSRKIEFRALVKLAAISITPLILFIVPWSIRNYNVLGKIIPFQENVYAGYGYLPTEIATRRLMNSMGEDGGTFWDPTAMASFFSKDKYLTSSYKYPNYLVRDTALLQQIDNLRIDYINSFGHRTPQQEDAMLSRTANLRRQYVSNYPGRYYFLNPFRRTMLFWGHSGSYYISIEKGNKVLLLGDKIVQSILYYLVLIFGTTGLIVLGRRKKIGWLLLLPLIILTLMLPMILGFMEPRYAISFYYPGLLGFVYLLDLLWQRQTFFVGNKNG